LVAALGSPLGANIRQRFVFKLNVFEGNELSLRRATISGYENDQDNEEILHI
jgi:hypothetical protein